jgi:hypothetical protein
LFQPRVSFSMAASGSVCCQNAIASLIWLVLSAGRFADVQTQLALDGTILSRRVDGGRRKRCRQPSFEKLSGKALGFSRRLTPAHWHRLLPARPRAIEILNQRGAG